ncbi:hypothetical protein [Mucilaginibacter segetis]|uniref:Uncharacterized protein n=1 Tax=Mucilaginibacter segetis TaxID=2793071 RepID=A0A934ULY7_9SPHI|nr:hypothetical protein [Mucilaginibacter segetis]MBK0379088.1 hypothetical protein [Mucilaginibacter segetis]
MEIEFQNTQDTYIQFFKESYKKHALKSLLFVGFISYFLVSLFLEKYAVPIQLIVLVLLCIALFFVLRYVLLLFVKQKTTGSNVLQRFQQKRITILADHLLIEYSNKTQKISYANIKVLEQTFSFIHLILNTKSSYLIPKGVFTSENECNSFIGAIHKNLIQIKIEKNGNLRWASDRPNYKLGFLGFIPLIGGIVGVILFIEGVFKYKDRKLIFIGIADIMFTVIVYSFLYFFGNSFFSRKQFADISQNQLNSLVENIEFYKLKYGDYPDSLQQISNDNTTVSIFDPTQSPRGTNPNFRYQKFDDGYYLFSAGPDEKPNTDDDIFPVPPIMKSGKIGLLIPRH